MNYKEFYNISCYEEFEIQSALMGISKVDILRNIGHKIDNYYFFVSDDGIFNWFDIEGNHIQEPGVLKKINCINIPKTITKCIIPNGVISIDDCTFYECNSLKEITIPDSVTSIGEYAFYHCKSLKEIIIPNSVISIGDKAFRYCTSLTSITIHNSITSIGHGTFFNCKSLKEITIPDSVINIECEAFSGCESLTSITIPDSVIYIGGGVFFDCNSITEIIFKGKTLDEVERMGNYPFGIEDENVFKFET